MSYSVWLKDDKNGIVEVEDHQEGAIFALGGSNLAEMNITYNYSKVYCLFDWKPRELDGKRARDTIPKLQEMVDKLGTRQYKDYWAPTPGNAGHAVNVLLQWAKQYPDATWKVR